MKTAARKSTIWASFLIAAVLSAIGVTALAFGQARKMAAGERYLFVWAGDQARKAPDFVAVVDFDAASPEYGKVIATAPLAGPGSTWNEPHHVGLSIDGRTLATGGLLSVLKGQKEIFFYDVSNPRKPTFVSGVDAPQSAITDEFYALPDGGFLVTMMGGAQGHHPGRVVELDRRGNIVAEHPKTPPDHGFNPHGISVRPELNLVVTSDFICPSTTLNAVPGDLSLRGSVRVWDYKARQITRTIDLPGAGGTIDVRLIPRDSRGRAYTAGMGDDKLYLIDTSAGAARPVFDFASVAPGAWPQLMRTTADGSRLFISLHKAGKIAMLDSSSPESPRLLSVLDLGPSSGPHYLALSRDERRLVVTDYFLSEDSVGKVQAEGDHKVHVATVTRVGLQLDPRFALDFNTAVPTGPARPHGVAMK